MGKIHNVPICNSTKEMEKAQLNLRLDDYGVPPPCRAMEKLYYIYEEASLNNTHLPLKDHFLLGLFVYDEQFREIVHSRYALIHFLHKMSLQVKYRILLNVIIQLINLYFLQISET